MRESYLYYRNMGATPQEAIEAARAEPTGEIRTVTVLNRLLILENPWLPADQRFVVHCPKVELYFSTERAALRFARDKRRARGIFRRSDRAMRKAGLCLT